MVHTAFAMIASALLMMGPADVERTAAGPPVACVAVDGTAPLTPCAGSLRVAAASLFADPLTDGLTTQDVPRKRGVLVPLYATLIGLHGYDAYSTLAAFNSGAVEANPLVKGAVARSALFVAVKGATAMFTIYTAERLWRKDRKAAAIAVMVVTNGMVAVVAAHNASVLRRLR